MTVWRWKPHISPPLSSRAKERRGKGRIGGREKKSVICMFQNKECHCCVVPDVYHNLEMVSVWTWQGRGEGRGRRKKKTKKKPSSRRCQAHARNVKNQTSHSPPTAPQPPPETGIDCQLYLSAVGFVGNEEGGWQRLAPHALNCVLTWRLGAGVRGMNN